MRKGKIIDLLIDLIFSEPKRSRFIYEYNKDWDATLNKIIDEGKFIEERELCAEFTYQSVNYSIQVGVNPYSYGHAEKINGEYVPYSLKFRPSERTMIKLREFLEAPYIAEEKRREAIMRKHITGKD
ncbi:hypothetical protein IDH70_04865 [Mixta calida]|nr:hypothetical protein IDH70_04865 [Mixta calida]